MSSIALVSRAFVVYSARGRSWIILEAQSDEQTAVLRSVEGPTTARYLGHKSLLPRLELQYTTEVFRV